MRRPPSDLPLRPAGYAVGELLIAILMLGVMVAATAPVMGAADSPADEAVRSLLSGITRAQRLAVTEQRNVILTLDPREPGIGIHVDADLNGRRDPGEAVHRVELERGTEWGAGAARRRTEDAAPITFSAGPDGEPRVVFRRNGSASEGGAVYLTPDGGAAEDSRLVLLSRGTGRGTAHRYTDGTWVPLGR